MNFLAPLFLLATVAIAGPIVFHLIRRTSQDVKPFSSLMFLDPVPPRLTQRQKLERPWLLLLRCLALSLLALAFARPFWRVASSDLSSGPGTGRRMVLLLDRSASMRRETLWPDALVKIQGRVRTAQPEDQIALVAFDRTPRVLLTFEEWAQTPSGERPALAAQRLSEQRPSYADTHLDRALIHATDLLEGHTNLSEPASREIVLISDLQEGARIDAIQAFPWPKHTTLTLDLVSPKAAENIGLAWLPENETFTPSPSNANQDGVRVRLASTAGQTREQFALRWGGGAQPGPLVAAYVPSGKTSFIRLPEPRPGSTRVVLSGDPVEFDDTVHILPLQPQAISVLYVGREDENAPSELPYFLHRAFPETRRQRVTIVAHREDGPVPGPLAAQAGLFVLGPSASSDAIESIRAAVEAGRTVLAPIESPAASARLLPLLGRVLPIGEATPRDYALLGEIDFQHPYFRPFNDPRFGDFTKIHFWHHRQLDLANFPETRILARFDQGSPALVEMRLGQGRLVLLATTWRPVDSQLALSSKFVPLLQGILDGSTPSAPPRAQFFVGDALPIDPGATSVVTPDGRTVAATVPFTDTALPGIYTASPGDARFVVNLSPDESRTRPMPAERLSAFGIPLLPVEKPGTSSAPARTQEQIARAVELENRQKIWRWALLAALACLIIETILAAVPSVRRPLATVPHLD